MIVRYRFAIICSILTLCGIMVVFGLKRFSNPIFKPESLIHDFGDVPTGGTLTYAFKFMNTGHKPLTIKNIQVSCGCVNDAHVNHQTIMPGNTELLHVSWESPRYETTIQENITITTNERRDSTHTFTMKANVISNYDVMPNIVNFGIVEANSQPQPIRINLSTKTKQEGTLIKALSTNSDIKTSITKVSNDSWMISASIDKDAPIGPIVGELFLSSSFGEDKQLPISGAIIGGFNAEPSEIYREFTPNEKGVQKIEFYSSDASRPKVSLLNISSNIKSIVRTSINNNTVSVNWDASPITAKQIKGYLLFNLKGNSNSHKLIVPVTFVKDK